MRRQPARHGAHAEVRRGTFFGGGHGEVFAGRDRVDAGDPRHELWSGVAHERSVAELAFFVVTPAEHLFVDESDAEPPTCRNRAHTGEVDGSRPRAAWDGGAHFWRWISELALCAPAPGENAATRQQGESVTATRGDRAHPAEPG